MRLRENAQDFYQADEVPTLGRCSVYQAELLMQLYDYHGMLQHGYLNSVLGQRDCLQTTNGDELYRHE